MEGNYLDKTLLKKTVMQSLALLLAVIVISLAVGRNNAVIISATDDEDEISHYTTETDIEKNDYGKEGEAGFSDKHDMTGTAGKIRLMFSDFGNDPNNNITDQLGNRFIIIKKPAGEELRIQLEDIYIARQLKLIISGYTKESIDDTFIGRICEDEAFIGEPGFEKNGNIIRDVGGTYLTTAGGNYGKDPVNSIYIENRTDDSGYNIHEIVLDLDHVYVYSLYEDEKFYYIDLKRPKEVYDKIVVIDAGHGGKDPGAVSKDEKVYEKSINLDILYELKELLDKDNVKVYYTRTVDETLYLRPRVTLANDVDCDFFISIHCNSSHKSNPDGTEILYYDHENNNIKTEDFAVILSEEIEKNVSLKNNGILQMRDDDIFILANAKVPAVIVETGYISNPADLSYLQSKAGQHDIAEGIYNGIWRAYKELKEYR